MRTVALLIAISLSTLCLSACGSYVAVQNGKCDAGRTWVPPSQDVDGKWKAGSCRDN